MPDARPDHASIDGRRNQITLRYDGPDVDNGTLPIDEVTNALQGFSGAYNKVMRLRGESTDHELRLSAVDKGSFELVILTWALLGQPPGALQSLEMAYDAARWIIERIFMIEVVLSWFEFPQIRLKLASS